MLTHSSCMYIEIQHHPADPTVIVEADGEESSRKGLKTISWPILDTDAVESSIAVKVMACLGKWQQRLETVAEAANPNPGEAPPVDREPEKDNKKATLARPPSC